MVIKKYDYKIKRQNLNIEIYNNNNNNNSPPWFYPNFL